MATISGKRFQITDGASTPTNLFPYTVTEAVYGLSTVIENAKTAVTSVLSAVTLNGVSKAGTTASFYAPTTAGTTGQILKATTSGAPVWTSAALGASNKPVYLNSSGVLTEGESCLPLTGGTLSTNATSILTLNRTGGNDWVYIAFQSNGTGIGAIGVKSTGVPSFLYSGTENTIWHSGNSNLSTVDWACKSLTANSGMIAGGSTSGVYFGAASGGLGSTYTGGLAYVYGNNPLYFHTNGTNRMIITGGGNVGIGATSPGYKLDVNGSVGCSSLTASGDTLLSYTSANGGIRTTTSGGYTYIQVKSASANAGSLYMCGFNAVAGNKAILNFDYVGIGTTSPSQKLHVAGSILSTGDQVVSSDLTLKTNLKDVAYSVSDIAKARAVEFDWKDGRGHSMGSIAQDWLGIAPTLVHGKEGNMSLAYGQLALVNTILLARQSESHEERIARLEKENAELKEEVKRLRMN